MLTPGGPASGGVINSHIFVDDDGTPFLFWKNDTNGFGRGRWLACCASIRT